MTKDNIRQDKPSRNGKANEGAPEPTAAQTAKTLLAASVSFIPIKVDGTKAPCISKWKPYQKRLPTEDEAKGWFGGRSVRGIAMIMGEVSGNAELIDFDSPPLIPAYRAAVEAEAPGLLARLIQIETPRGGLHLIYRCSVIEGNQKLAQEEIPATEKDIESDTARKSRTGSGEMVVTKTMIETRGEGGYAVTVGSPARCHELKKTYILINGDLSTIPTITPEERERLLRIARQFSKMPPEETKPVTGRSDRPAGDGTRPGDDFNSHSNAAEMVADLLARKGWIRNHGDDLGSLWRRPGKEAGWSARLFADGCFWPFSSNAAPFEAEHAYSPFAVYAYLEHEKDFAAAAKALHGMGFGDQSKKKSKSAPLKSAPMGVTPAQPGAAVEMPLTGQVEDPTDAALKYLAEARERIADDWSNVTADATFWARLSSIRLTRPDDFRQWKVIAKEKGIGSRHFNELVRKNEPAPARPVFADEAADSSGQFCINKGVIHRFDKLLGLIEICNFAVTITQDVTEDDDIEERREYIIEGRVRGENITQKGRVRAEDFPKLQWVDRILGGGAYIQPREHDWLRAAVKALSSKRTHTRIVTYTGWHDVGEGPEFFHAGGSIGARGLIARNVHLDDGLAMYSLPDPLKGDDLRNAFEMFQKLRLVEDGSITAPLLGATLTAPIDTPDFSIFAVGETGTGKTTYTLLCLSPFGKDFVEGKAPAEWEGSTAYGLQVKAFKAKNLPLQIDEYVPRTSRDGVKLTAVVTTVLRKQGNRAGRTAGRSDGGLRAEFCPRGLIVGTGEDVPPGESVRARMAIVQFTERLDKKNKTSLSEMQAAARKGVFAGLMSAYLSWLARGNRLGILAEKRAEQINEMRTRWIERLKNAKVHPRTASNFAALERGWQAFYQFAIDLGLLTKDQGEAAMRDVIAGLAQCAKAQAIWQMSSNPVKRFVNLISIALASGKAHLVAPSEQAWSDDERLSFGWRKDTRGDWTPQGENVGFFNPEGVFLHPASAMRMVNAYAANGEGIALTERQLITQLKTAGVITPDTTRGTGTVRRKLAGSTHHVLFFQTKVILEGIETEAEDDADRKTPDETDIEASGN